jgi:type II secretory pathway component GspD/PulD (secretin)
MLRSVFISAIMCSVLSVSAVQGADLPADERFDVSIRDQNVRDVLTEVSSVIGVPILLSDAVEGRVSVGFDQATAVELLDGIAKERALDWRFDGSRIRVTAQSEQITRIVDLDGVKLSELFDALRSLDTYDERFSMTAVDGEFAMVVAPPDYVAVVEVVLGALAERRAEAEADRAEAESERRELERLAAEQKLEFDRLEREAALERFKLEQQLFQEWRREQLLNQRRGPTVVRNGVWGG